MINIRTCFLCGRESFIDDLVEVTVRYGHKEQDVLICKEHWDDLSDEEDSLCEGWSDCWWIPEE